MHIILVLLIDKTMIKSEGCAKSKVCMPKNQSSIFFKMYCQSCSFCGSLCGFLMNSGKYVNPVCGKTVKKKFEVADTIKELVLESYSYTSVSPKNKFKGGGDI